MKNSKNSRKAFLVATVILAAIVCYMNLTAV